jgi:hypothetical protein
MIKKIHTRSVLPGIVSIFNTCMPDSVVVSDYNFNLKFSFYENFVMINSIIFHSSDFDNVFIKTISKKENDDKQSSSSIVLLINNQEYHIANCTLRMFHVIMFHYNSFLDKCIDDFIDFYM